MKYISFCLKNLEPIKIGSQNVSETAAFCLDYITGAAIRGAVIGKMIQHGYSMDDTAKKRRLLQHVRFLNAYPVAGEERSYPAPFCYMADKKKLTQYTGENLEIKCIGDSGIEQYKVVKKEPFVIYRGEAVEGLKVKKQFQLHISVNGRNAGSDKERAMFRYESIAAGHTFKAIIVLDSESVALEHEIVEQLKDGSIYYLGGSKGSGYGKCIVYGNLQVSEHNPEHNAELAYAEGNDLYFYYLSDAILQNPSGEISDHIDEDYMATMLGVDEITYHGGAVDNVVITGYNNTWNAALPQVMGIRSGTIQHYRIHGAVSQQLQERIQDFEQKGVGLRKEDGFGRFIVIQKPNRKCWKQYQQQRTEKAVVALSEESTEQLQMILNRLYIQYALQRTEAYISQVGRRLERWHIKVSSSQVGKLIEKVRRYQIMTPAEAKEDLQNYFTHMQEKKNNQRVYRSFIDTRIGEVNLKEYMLHCLEQSDKILLFQSVLTAEQLQAGGVKPDISSEDIYFLNTRYLENLLRYLRKCCDEEGKRC